MAYKLQRYLIQYDDLKTKIAELNNGLRAIGGTLTLTHPGTS